MFVSKLFICITVAILLTNINADGDGNIHIFKKEIAKAMENCADKNIRKEAMDEFDRRASSPMKTERYKRENNYDNDSGDWDYDDGNKSNGKSWYNPKDEKYSRDSVYNHERRNDTQDDYGNQRSSGSMRNQNTTNSGQRYQENNFDSRGARYTPESVKTNYANRKRNSKDFELILHPYNSYANGFSAIMRKKRNSGFIKSSSDNECLSQCVFTNLQIVDDRGIPKEPLFIKLVQNNITSQQTKSLIEKQIQSCFRELIAESEDNECSYSNALERCMGLELKKRKIPENDSP